MVMRKLFKERKMNPKICPNCGRAMTKNSDDDKWECSSCGNEEQIYYGPVDDY